MLRAVRGNKNGNNPAETVIILDRVAGWHKIPLHKGGPTTTAKVIATRGRSAPVNSESGPKFARCLQDFVADGEGI